jgi:hypothetical protein
VTTDTPAIFDERFSEMLKFVRYGNVPSIGYLAMLQVDCRSEVGDDHLMRLRRESGILGDALYCDVTCLDSTPRNMVILRWCSLSALLTRESFQFIKRVAKDRVHQETFLSSVGVRVKPDAFRSTTRASGSVLSPPMHGSKFGWRTSHGSCTMVLDGLAEREY